jgi:DAK2 domain fusion protein YloV
MALFYESLRAHRDELDSLNVYPVPDGDTGTNMLLTQEAVEASLSSIPEMEPFAVIGPAISRASLMGARGNSGVILSQVLRGFCEVLPPDRPAGVSEVAAALEHASREAYRAVARPVEGTILSVLRDGARAATGAAAGEAGVAATAEVLTAALGGARDSLAGTQEVLPELRQAGVIDAGGKGIVLFLDALRAAVTGEHLSEPSGPMGPVGRGGVEAASDRELAFEVQYLLEAPHAAVGALRPVLEELGDSLVIVGGGGVFNVHVHTDQPDRALAAGHEVGRLRETSVVHLGEQVARCMSGQARAVRVAEHTCGLVAVAEGVGVAATLRSLGALVVARRPGADLSVSEIQTAIDSRAEEVVIVLPNGGSVTTAAEEAASRSAKEVRVILIDAPACGLSAAAAFNPFTSLEENAKAMDEAAGACRSGEVARADHDAVTTAGAVKEGEWIGFVEGEPVRVGPRADEIAVEVVRRLAGPQAEALTLIVGAEAGEDRMTVEDALRDAFPALDLQVVEGGHPPHALQIGVE